MAENEVTIVDIDVPFGALVGFLIKLTLASAVASLLLGFLVFCALVVLALVTGADPFAIFDSSEGPFVYDIF